MTATTTVPTGKLVVTTDDRRSGEVVDATSNALRATAGMFTVNTGTRENPYFTFARLTGRTRRMWGMACPTVELYEVDTVALPTEVDGAPSFALWGVPGARIPGMWLTRPENVIVHPVFAALSAEARRVIDGQA